MLVIMTLNPSLDYYMKMKDVKLGETNHAFNESIQIGGKGINVAMMLDKLKRDASLYGFVGGFTGDYLIDSLKSFDHINPDFIQSNSLTRINVKVSTETETELNGTGSLISSDLLEALNNKIDMLNSNDTVMISGRLAQGMPDDWYIELAKKLSEKGIEFTVDITGRDVLKICEYGPLILKPNLSELEAMFEVSIDSDEDIVKYGKKLIDLGAKNCIVSLGSKGSMFFNGHDVYSSNIPKGRVINTVGAGDSMLAGFIHTYLETKDVLKAYKMAVACGSATTYSIGIGSEEMVTSLLTQININKKGD